MEELGASVHAVVPGWKANYRGADSEIPIKTAYLFEGPTKQSILIMVQKAESGYDVTFGFKP